MKAFRGVALGIVVGVLAIEPKIRGFKLGGGRWILMAIKIRSTTSFGGEVKPLVPCRNVFFYGKLKEPYENKRDTEYSGKIHRTFLRQVSPASLLDTVSPIACCLRKFVKFVKKIQSDCCKQKCDLWKCI
jgi:hypothetical protein